MCQVRRKPIGSTQEALVDCLIEHGSWQRNCGWNWDGDYRTEKVLKSLVKRGIALVDADGVYQLSHEYQVIQQRNKTNVEV